MFSGLTPSAKPTASIPKGFSVRDTSVSVRHRAAGCAA
jgi:hypothetical protein